MNWHSSRALEMFHPPPPMWTTFGRPFVCFNNPGFNLVCAGDGDFPTELTRHGIRIFLSTIGHKILIESIYIPAHTLDDIFSSRNTVFK